MGLFTLQYCCVSSSYIGLGVVPGYRSFFHENEWNCFTEKRLKDVFLQRFYRMKQNPRVVCSYTCCSQHEMNMNWMIPHNRNLENTVYSVKDDEQRFQDIEALGSENENRCVSCRNCTKFKNGNMLEKVSHLKELEQAMIENSVELIVEQKRFEAKLSFIDDPFEKVKPTRIWQRNFYNLSFKT